LESFARALRYAFLLLKYRARSSEEIRARLLRRRYPSDIIRSVLAYLEEHGFIDDEEFALTFMRERLAEGWGPRKIVFALKRFGVPDEFIEKALAVQGARLQKKALRDLIERKIERYKARPDWFPRMYRYLAQRGFEAYQIREVLNDYR
jgi:regulatory protein